MNLHIADANPLINIQNANQLQFRNVNYNAADLLFRISGDRNSGITSVGLDPSKAKSKNEFLAGASEKSLQINK